MSRLAMAMAKTDIKPIFSSAQASERVRGMIDTFHDSGEDGALRKKAPDVRVLRRAQLACAALEGDESILEHDELGLLALHFVRRHDAVPRALPHGLVRRHEEGIAQLMRDDDR